MEVYERANEGQSARLSSFSLSTRRLTCVPSSRSSTKLPFHHPVSPSQSSLFFWLLQLITKTCPPSIQLLLHLPSSSLRNPRNHLPLPLLSLSQARSPSPSSKQTNIPFFFSKLPLSSPSTRHPSHRNISSSRQSPFQRSTRPSRTSRSPSSLDKTQTTSNTPTDPNLFPPLPLNLPHPPTSPSTPISLSPPSSQTASLPRRRIRLLSPTSDDGRRWRRTILIPSVWRRRKRRWWEARGREMWDGSEAWTRRGQSRREGRRWKNV